MKLFAIFALCYILFAGYSCGNRTDRNQVSLKEENVILVSRLNNVFKDSLIIYGVGSLTDDNENLFVAHKGAPHLVVFNANFEIIDHFANNGDGPGESGAVESINVSKSGVVAFDTKHQVFNHYTKDGEFLRSIKHPMNTPLVTRFTVHDSTIYFTNISDTAVVESIVLKEPYTTSTFIKDFYPLNYKSREEKFATNYRHILPYNNQIISIGETQPVIDVYGQDGTKNSSFDLKGLDIFNDEYQYNIALTKKNPSLRSKSLIIIRDAKIYENSLYLLLVRHRKNQVTGNTIVKLAISGNRFSFESVYNLLPSEKIRNPKNFPWYRSFSVLKGKIIAYESALDEFHNYEIK